MVQVLVVDAAHILEFSIQMNNRKIDPDLRQNILKMDSRIEQNTIQNLS